MPLNKSSSPESHRVAEKLRDRICDHVSLELRQLLSSKSAKDTSDIIEMALYATLGTFLKSRYESEKKIACIDLKDPRNRLKIEKMVVDQICDLAVSRLEVADPGAAYVVVIGKRDRPLKNG